MNQWQPIETAPVGKPCLVYAPPWEYNGRKYPAVVTTAYQEYQGQSFWMLCEAGYRAEDRDMTEKVTHWMPIPEPPHD